DRATEIAAPLGRRGTAPFRGALSQRACSENSEHPFEVPKGYHVARLTSNRSQRACSRGRGRTSPKSARERNTAALPPIRPPAPNRRGAAQRDENVPTGGPTR